MTRTINYSKKEHWLFKKVSSKVRILKTNRTIFPFSSNKSWDLSEKAAPVLPPAPPPPGSWLQLTGGASSKQQVHVRVRKRKHGAAALPGAHTCEAAAHLVPALAGVWGALRCPV